MNPPKSPQISVCIPVYNASPFLRECIDSILAQTFIDFEILIVDDGSTDNSSDIVLSYTDSRIRLIKKNHDYIGSLNLLLREARGKYIARMDADDIMLKERLQIQYDFMEKHKDVDILGSAMQCFGEMITDKSIPNCLGEPKKEFFTKKAIKEKHSLFNLPVNMYGPIDGNFHNRPLACYLACCCR